VKTNKAWILKRVQDDMVQKASDSERSEYASFAQGEVSRFNRTESIHLYKLSNRVKTSKVWILKRYMDSTTSHIQCNVVSTKTKESIYEFRMTYLNRDAAPNLSVTLNLLQGL
ncbi:hypothetical protein, partial [Pseudoalteromonas luteoviolacea]|uniref:hypothetical protein n=1 Tax=Pseudoalteromonas luteoviolacea TaxID=43657 RepID=UPI000A7036E2